MGEHLEIRFAAEDEQFATQDQKLETVKQKYDNYSLLPLEKKNNYHSKLVPTMKVLYQSRIQILNHHA